MVKKSKAKPAPQLPEGWQIITKVRSKGLSKGRRVRTFLSPEMESFRSLRAAQRFLIAKAHAAVKAFIAANAAEEKDKSDNVLHIVTDQAAKEAEDLANDANDDSNVVTVVDSSSGDESDDDSMWM